MGIDLTPHTSDAAECCGGDSCDPGGLSRRSFIALGTLTTLGATGALGALPAGAVVVPAEKHLPRSWLDAIAARGTASEYTGEALRRIGMPVGGACTGQVYLAGDGRLWLWDVFNPPGFPYGGAD